MRLVLGLGLVGLAVLLLAFELVALADPVGTKLADDGDPFGNPYVPWWVHLAWFVAIALIASMGVWLARSRPRDRERAT